MKISIITLFPEIFEPVLNSSILKRAQQKGLVTFSVLDLRTFGIGAHKTVDDSPYGGGAGMVLKPEVLASAVRSIQSTEGPSKVILTSASGRQFSQFIAREYSQGGDIIIVCGHYEGVDQRFIDHYVDDEISIGDYVLTGGEIPAMILSDAITRLIPGVLEKEGATENESYEQGLLEHPHYTRPEVFEDLAVPEVLLSGNHSKIDEWRQEESVKKTKQVRPDLITK